MNFQEKFKLDCQSSPYFSKEFDILITGLREDSDERHSFFKRSLTNFSGQIYSFDTCENAEQFSYKIEDADGVILEDISGKSLIPDLEKLLKAKDFQGGKICIDITTIKQSLLFLLIKLFVRDVKPSLLFAGYTEPTEYKKRKTTAIGDNEEYDLYDRIIGSSKGVPGFIKSQSQNPILLVAPIGFDSQRLQTIYENLKPKKMIPIIGFPSFIPGWNLTAIKMNYMVLRSSNSVDMIETCEAASPFEIYNLLQEIYHRHISDYDIYISPLGTRPHCLGAALFAARNPSVFLVYDFPLEKKFRSESILKANIYHISNYLS